MWVSVVKLKNAFGAQLLTSLLDAWLVHEWGQCGRDLLPGKRERERERIKRYADDIRLCKYEADWWILGSSGFSLSVPANQTADVCLCVVGCVTIWWLVFKLIIKFYCMLNECWMNVGRLFFFLCNKNKIFSNCTYITYNICPQVAVCIFTGEIWAKTHANNDTNQCVFLAQILYYVYIPCVVLVATIFPIKSDNCFNRGHLGKKFASSSPCQRSIAVYCCRRRRRLRSEGAVSSAGWAAPSAAAGKYMQ